MESILVDDTIPNQRLGVNTYKEYLALPGILRNKIYPKSFNKQINMRNIKLILVKMLCHHVVLQITQYKI
jgi:hypothetical protein